MPALHRLAHSDLKTSPKFSCHWSPAVWRSLSWRSRWSLRAATVHRGRVTHIPGTITTDRGRRPADDSKTEAYLLSISEWYPQLLASDGLIYPTRHLAAIVGR